ncbi:hypothetical protein ScPMuIL_012651 [Solemya velum]
MREMQNESLMVSSGTTIKAGHEELDRTNSVKTTNYTKDSNIADTMTITSKRIIPIALLLLACLSIGLYVFGIGNLHLYPTKLMMVKFANKLSNFTYKNDPTIIPTGMNNDIVISQPPDSTESTIDGIDNENYRKKLGPIVDLTEDQVYAQIIPRILPLSSTLQDKMDKFLSKARPQKESKLVCGHIRKGRNSLNDERIHKILVFFKQFMKASINRFLSQQMLRLSGTVPMKCTRISTLTSPGR